MPGLMPRLEHMNIEHCDEHPPVHNFINRKKHESNKILHKNDSLIIRWFALNLSISYEIR